MFPVDLTTVNTSPDKTGQACVPCFSRENRFDDKQNICRTLGKAPHVPPIPRRAVTDERLHDVTLRGEPTLSRIENSIEHVDLIGVVGNTRLTCPDGYSLEQL